MATRVLKFVPSAILVLLAADLRPDRHAVLPRPMRERDRLLAGRFAFTGGDLTDLSSEASY
jgi:hypothetical protein